MTLEIKINLAKPPAEAPWDFPHQCLSLAFRIRAALDVLEGVEPWGEDEGTSPARFLAYRQLAELRDLAHHLVRAPRDSASPFDEALKVIDVKFKRDWEAQLRWERSVEDAKNFFRGGTHDWTSLTRVDLPKLKEEFLGHVQHLENLGVYFLRMMQAASGKNLPEEHMVKPAERSARWNTIVESDFE